MTLRFAAPAYPNGRHCLLCGTVTVGAVYPPGFKGYPWGWRLWVSRDGWMLNGEAKTEEAAKDAAISRFREFLVMAELEVKS